MSNTPQSNDTQYSLLRKILVALNSSVAGIPDSLSTILTDIQSKVTTLVSSVTTIGTNTGTTATNTGNLVSRLVGGFTASAVSQARVAVNGNNVTLLAAAGGGVNYRDIQIQNLGTTPVFVRLTSGADNTGANGEFILAAAGSANDGTGGVYRVSGYLGIITGASAAAVNVSVTAITL